MKVKEPLRVWVLVRECKCCEPHILHSAGMFRTRDAARRARRNEYAHSTVKLRTFVLEEPKR